MPPTSNTLVQFFSSTFHDNFAYYAPIMLHFRAQTSVFSTRLEALPVFSTRLEALPSTHPPWQRWKRLGERMAGQKKRRKMDPLMSLKQASSFSWPNFCLMLCSVFCKSLQKRKLVENKDHKITGDYWQKNTTLRKPSCREKHNRRKPDYRGSQEVIEKNKITENYIWKPSYC